MDINFKSIFKHFDESFIGTKYKKYTKNELSKIDKEKYKAMSDSGTKSLEEFKKIGEYFEQKGYVYNKKLPSWQKQNQHMNDYFWIELKEKILEYSTSSISIFIDKDELRVVIEIKSNKSNKEDHKYHNKYLENILNLTEKELEKYEYWYNKTDEANDKIEKAINQDVKLYAQKVINREYHKLQVGYSLSRQHIEKLMSDDINSVTKNILLWLEKKIEEIATLYRIAAIRNKEVELYQHNNLNTILYGPPGTGKTYNLVKYAVKIIEGKTKEDIDKEIYSNLIDRFNKYKDKGQIEFVTFHQSYSYEDFIEGIRPVMNEVNEIKYRIEPGKFKAFCDIAQEDESEEKFVFIIDEINRGNISKIFGELITLIENEKRIGRQEALTLSLQYSNKPFGVPENVHILGTMNTADRSIALLDTAIRRRFEFKEIMPDVDILKKLNNEKDLEVNIDGISINVCEMIKKINKRIEVLYDRDHTIGHAYFMELVKEPTLEKLEGILQKKIIPLLQEYFYDDYQSIRLILADNQVKDSNFHFIKEESIDSELFGNDVDLDDRKIFKVNDDAFKLPNSYIKIYSTIVEEGK